jgi:Spy/CpxP family protein refolding chaperone
MKKLGVFVVIVLAMVSTSLYSQPAEGKRFGKIIEKMKLTEKQKTDVDKIQLDMKKQEIAQKAKIETAQVDLRQLFKVDNPDKSAIEWKLSEISKLEVQMHMIRIDSWFTINKLLTPEQQKTWKKALEAGPAMRQKMMKHQKMKDHGMGKGQMPARPDAPMPKQ